MPDRIQINQPTPVITRKTMRITKRRPIITKRKIPNGKYRGLPRNQQDLENKITRLYCHNRAFVIISSQMIFN